YCRGSKHQKNGLAPLEERKRLCDPPNLPNLISFICLFPINMQPLALFLRKEPGGLSSISLPTFVGSPFLFDAMGARRRMRPPILSFPRCRIFWNACGIIYSVVESGGKWGEGETAGCSWGNTGIPWTIRVV